MMQINKQALWQHFSKLSTKLQNRAWVHGLPNLWLFVFFLIPFLIVLKISFSFSDLALPPYKPLFEWGDDLLLTLKLNFANYAYIFEDNLYIDAFFNSVKLAFFATLMTLCVGYPMAYGIARTKGSFKHVLLLLVILPFWTSFLIRVYAWIGILKNNGLLNTLLMYVGLIDEPLILLHTNIAVYIGIVYTYLPFMILPLYTSLEKMDTSLLEAASDLGAKPWRTFVTITLPLSLPGIIAGCLLVFIPVIGEYVIPDLLGGADTLMIGKVLWEEFFNNRDWPLASALAVLMLIFLVLPIILFQRLTKTSETS